MHLLLVSLPGPTDNTPVLRALEYGVIILLWLFFMWVVRAVWVEVRPLKRRRRRDANADPVVAGPKRRRGQAAPPPRHPARGPGRPGLRHRRRGDGGSGRRAAASPSITTPTPPTCTPACSAWTATCGPRTWAPPTGPGSTPCGSSERTRLEKGDLLQVGGTVFEVGK